MSRRKWLTDSLVNAFLLLALLASASVTLAISRTKSVPTVGLVAVPAEVRLGEVGQQKDVPFDFQLENWGTGNVVINEVIVPCSCTQLDLAAKTRLAPGASLHVHGSVGTINRRGRFETAIALTYRDEGTNRSSTIPIPITVVVKPSIAASQDVLSIDGDTWSALNLWPGTAESFRILAIEPSDPYILWEADGSQLGKETSDFRLKVRLDRQFVPEELSPLDGKHWIEFTTSISTESRFRLPVVLNLAEGMEN